MSPADFSFPLNVYFSLLQWEEGRADFLHYGLFEHADEPIHAAQARASARLWAQIPPAGRVLDVGIGIGNTLAALQAAGRDALGITPEPAQAAAAQARHGSQLPVAVTPLEATSPQEHGRFDVMLFQESAQYIQPLALFEAADRLLNDGATVVVMDEFALRRDSGADSGLHLLPQFVALAARFGWRVVVDEDVSAYAGTTVSVLLRLLGRWRSRVLVELGLPPPVLDDLIAALRRYDWCYAHGVYGYRVLKLERARRPLLRLGRVHDAQAPAMQQLFPQLFGHAMSAEEWHWKYGGGRGGAVALYRGPDMVAHYGGLSRPLLLMGRPVLGCQVADVMVAPAANAGLERQLPLYDVTATFLECEIGWSQRHLVGYGFPNARAMRVAERLGLYAPVDEIVQLGWSALSEAGGELAKVECIEAGQLHPGTGWWPELDALWADMAQSLPASVLGVRDPAWLHHRYGMRPSVSYTLLVRRDAGSNRALGAVVLRVHADRLEVMDLVAHASLFPSLVFLARTHAARIGLPWVHAWVTRSHAALLQDANDPARIDVLDVTVPANAHMPGPAPAELQGRWFLMGGDTDFR